MLPNRFVPLDAMSPARLYWSTSVASRSACIFLLCAVALGIVGMHGLAQGGDTEKPLGHHFTQTVDVVSTAPTPYTPSASSDSSPGEGGNSGLFTLCLMVLAPAVAVGLWLLVRSRVGGWRPRRMLVRDEVPTDIAIPPPSLWQRATVLRI